MNRRGFSLLELILALGLSSVIMFAFMQINRSMHQFIEKSRESFLADRKVCLLFNQLERDITSASIPVISSKNDEKEGTENQKDEGDKKNDQKQQKEEPVKDPKDKKKNNKKLNPFVVDIFDGETTKRKGKKLELLRSMSMITLNSLETYADQSPRLLRVFYELKENKNRPFKDKKSYSLYRKQTSDLYNTKVKELEDKDSKDKKTLEVKTYLVADTIEFISLEFYRAHNLPKDEKDKDAKKEQKTISGFVWGQKEETQNILPEYALVTISLWAENYKTTSLYECMMPIFAYNAPALPKKKEKKEPDKNLDPNATTTQQAQQSDKPGQQPQNQQAQQTGQPGQAGQSQQGQLSPLPEMPDFGSSLDMKNIFKAAETILAQMGSKPPSFALLEPGYLDALKKGMMP